MNPKADLDLELRIGQSYYQEMAHVDKPGTYIKFGDVTKYEFTKAGKKRYDINKSFEENMLRFTEGVHYQVVHYTEEQLKQKKIDELEEAKTFTLKEIIRRDNEKGKMKRKHKGLPYYPISTIDDY